MLLRIAERHGKRVPPIVPILCGSFDDLVASSMSPMDDRLILEFILALQELAEGHRTLFIAGGDLAHVGPRFGDRRPWDAACQQQLEAHDRELLRYVTEGDAERFFHMIALENDCYRICGLPPVYTMLLASRATNGRLIDYVQCPAGEGSFVSVAGAAFGTPAAVRESPAHSQKKHTRHHEESRRAGRRRNRIRRCT